MRISVSFCKDLDQRKHKFIDPIKLELILVLIQYSAVLSARSSAKYFLLFYPSNCVMFSISEAATMRRNLASTKASHTQVSHLRDSVQGNNNVEQQGRKQKN